MLYIKQAFIIIVLIFASISLFSCNYGARKYADAIGLYSEEYGVEEAIVFAVCETESHFNARARSKVGAIGLMQIMPDTAQWIARAIGMVDFKTDDLYDPTLNIRFGVWYLSYLFSIFDESWQVFAAYNAGETAVKDWLKQGKKTKEDIPYAETANYVKKIERSIKHYRKKIAAFI